MNNSALRVALVAVIIPAAFAKTPLPVDPALVSTVTDGYWESAGMRGHYRVLLFRGGLEHITSRVVAEWVADPTGTRSDARVAHSSVLVDDCMCSLDTPRLDRLPVGVRVTLTGELTHIPGQNVTCAFELQPDGQVKVLSKC
jgi:hypothetical protein